MSDIACAGSTLHHATELIGSSFRIDHNPQAKQGGSCGCGVSWEAVEA
jgi:Fe-S cluster assembly iron-binding protein IscA